MTAVLPLKDSRFESKHDPAIVDKHEDRIIQQAIALLEQRIFRAGNALEKPSDACDFLRLMLVGEPNEIFAALFLDARHQVLAYEPLFRGTIDQSMVYPRVVVQRALAANAAAVIFAHQHPSGNSKPSAADRMITRRLRDALDLIDIRVLDHFIIGQGEPYSFAESGLL
jgi:DNA repair protein RadC